MGSKPSKQDPFARAESWLRQRRDAKIDLRDASLSSLVVGFMQMFFLYGFLQLHQWNT